MRKTLKTMLCAFSVLAICSTGNGVQAAEKTMLVLDASGSMWGQLDGKTKIEIARDALKTLLADWPQDREVGLVAYGHRSKGDCKDIETLIPVGTLDVAKMSRIVDQLNPKGKTPLSAAVKQAAEALKYTEDKATVILLSDGKETCGMDPCALGSELEKLGVDFTAHVIGFDVSKTEDQAGLRCLAENTGGQFIPAGNASELKAALEQTAQAPEPEEPEPAATPEPKPAPEPPTLPSPTASLKPPGSAIKGTEIKVELTADAGLDGYIYLYAQGKEKHISYGRVVADDAGAYKPSELRLPAVPGEYTLKWLTSKDEVIAEAPLTITDAKIALESPASAPKGTEIKVGLNAPDGLDGYVYLYAQGKEKHISYGRVVADDAGAYKPSELRLPAVPGEYTLKWLTSKDEVIAEAPLTITDAKIALESPASAPKGTEIKVGLNAPDGLDGYVYLYAQGKEKYISYGRVNAANIGGYQPSELRLPATPGAYTLKWVNSKDEVIAEAPLAIMDAAITLDAPAQIEKGATLKVGLNGPDGLDGYIYLYAQGKEKYITYGRVQENAIKGYDPSTLTLPDTNGDYVLKWLSSLDEVLAEHNISVVDKVAEPAAEPDTEPAAKPVPATEGASGSTE